LYTGSRNGRPFGFASAIQPRAATEGRPHSATRTRQISKKPIQKPGFSSKFWSGPVQFFVLVRAKPYELTRACVLLCEQLHASSDSQETRTSSRSSWVNEKF